MPIVEPVQREPSEKSSRAPLIILFLTVFIDLLGFGIVIPFLPLYAGRLGVGALGIGLVLAVYSLMQFLCAPLLGRISDYVGRRPIIMLGLLGSSIGYVIYGFAFSFALLLISRAVHGMCAGTVSTAQAYVADTMPESKRAHGMGMIGAAFGLGFVLGPAIGGLLGHASLRMPVFFAAGLTFANLIFAALALPESHTPSRHVRLELKRIVEPVLMLPRQLTGHRLSRLFTIAFLLTFTISVWEATFALMVPAIYGYRALGVGVLLAYAGLMQAITQGYLLRKIVGRAGEPKLIRLGALLLAIGMIPLASSSSHAMLFVLLALLSLGYGFASPSVASLISRRSERHQQGEVLGVNQSALSLARIFGPIAAGLVYELAGPVAAYAGGGAVALAALALAASIEPAHQPEPAREADGVRL
ncbi:MAG: MFS transporter [Candidatus Binataceae bacterium]